MKMRTDIQSIEEIENFINEKDAILLYFSTSTCNVCEVLKPKIEEEFKKNFPKIEQVFINATDAPQVAAHFQVFSTPTILIFLQSKEFARESRNVGISQLIEKVRRPYDIMNSD